MNKTFNLLFFIKKNKIRTNGTAPIYLRITIDGKAADIAAKRYIDPQKWDVKAHKAVGNSQEAKTLNVYLKTLEQQVYDSHYQMLKEEDFVTSEGLKSKLLGTDVSTRMLIPIFQDHNDKVEALVGQDFAPGTLERYKTSLKHTQEFLNWKYKISDIEERKITEKYNEILKKFHERNSTFKTEPIPDNKTEQKKEPYSFEVIEDIKVKLKKFEEDKLFLAKNLTLPKVAKMLGRNHSQLSYVLNEHLGISFTHYLKTLRIGYITNHLVENKLYLQYKVENLANECGMSSRQLFSTHFFEINGIRPIEFIRERIKENEEK